MYWGMYGESVGDAAVGGILLLICPTPHSDERSQGKDN